MLAAARSIAEIRYQGAAKLRVQVGPDGTLQPGCTLAQGAGKVLEIIASSDSELADKILGRRLEVAIVILDLLILGPSKVGVGGDGGGTLKALEARLSLGLRVGVKRALAEILVGRDTLLVAEFGARILLVVVCVPGLINCKARVRVNSFDNIPSALTGPTDPKPPAFFLLASGLGLFPPT